MNDNEIHMTINGIDIDWDLKTGNLNFLGISSTLFWNDPSLLNMFKPLVEEIGQEMYCLQVAHSSSLGTKEDYTNMVTQFGRTFEEGFLNWGKAVSGAGWGIFEMPIFNRQECEATVVIHNPWELKMQEHLPENERWGCPFIQGKIIGIFNHAFNQNCWAKEALYFEDDTTRVEFTLYKSHHTIEHKIQTLREKNEKKKILKFKENIHQALKDKNNLIEKEKKLIKDLTKSERELSHIFNSALVGLMYISGERKLIKANQTVANIFGYDSPETMIGMSMKELHTSEKKFIAFGKKNFETLKLGANQNITYELRKKDGSKIWCELSGKTLDNNIPADLSQGVLWVVSDITNQREQAENLQQSELLKKNIIASVPDLLWLKDTQGKYLACNPRFEKLFGVSEEQIIGKSDYDFVNKEMADSFRKHDKNAMNSNTPISNFEEVTFASDGHSEYLDTTKTKLLDASGNIFGVLGIGRDISETKALQNSLEGERNKYKKLMENSSDSIFIVDLEGYIVEYSKLFKQILGFSNSDIHNLHISDFEAIHSKELIKKNLQKTQKESLAFESKYRKKDGSLIDVDIHAVRVEINNKAYVYSSFRDITEEKRTQDFITKTNTILQMIATGKEAPEVYDEIALMYEQRHKGMRCSLLELKNGILLHGGAPSMPQAYRDAVHGLKIGPEVGSCGTSTYFGHRVLVENIETDHKWEKIKQFALPHGMRCCWSEPIINSTGQVLGAFGMYYDYPALPNEDESNDLISASQLAGIVMERDQAQKRLYQNQKIIAEQSKLASMGEMIGNIAHQWRQPLSIITTYASGLKLDAEFENVSKEKIDTCTESIIEQANYLSKTIDNFRNFIKSDQLNSMVSLKDIINNSLVLVNASLRNNFITVIPNINDDLKIFGNKNELTEAFINILNNSKDILKSSIKNESDRLIFIESKKYTEYHIELFIYDSGGGIDENVINKVFEPYFTTKHQSQGTGLGLAMSEKIIQKRHHGTMRVYNKTFSYNSKTYTGACFSITFRNMPKKAQ